MKLNMKVRYGLRALVDIASNQQTGDGVLQKDISRRQEIPLKYLDAIITGLRNSGLIMNVAGKGSGYKLMKAPDEIFVYNVYRAFEPELLLVNCLCDNMQCKRTDICPVRDYWFELNLHIKSVMQNSSLRQIMDRSLKMQM